ncbi:MAG: hypothetical protein AMJ42_06300 [Deltaproteobacteria bacterium DG_8]|jgi:hypothetical protein|nr:MAG: hypothetical protein AMJ42_06300 [Deltaproteobacteria bacterium DG_8]
MKTNTTASMGTGPILSYPRKTKRLGRPVIGTALVITNVPLNRINFTLKVTIIERFLPRVIKNRLRNQLIEQQK